MLALDEVDGLVSGAVHTTANTIRPALQLIRTAPGVTTVSSVFFMLMPNEVLVYGDCAVNPDPTAEELADIAVQSADSARAFGIDPRVAMISYSTGTSGGGADVDKVVRALALARAKRPDLLIDGPLQYDAASVESVGRQKAPDSPVAGRASVFVFPDLNTGNTTYKAVQRSAHVVSPHFSPNQMLWGIDSEKILLSPQLFSNPRNAPMPTECSATLFEFPPLEGRQVVASFDGGAITTDAGALL